MLRDEDFEDKRPEEVKQAERKERALLDKRNDKRWRPVLMLIAIQSAIIIFFPENWISSTPIKAFTDWIASFLSTIDRMAYGASEPQTVRTAYAFSFFISIINIFICLRNFIEVYKKESKELIRYQSVVSVLLTLLLSPVFYDIFFGIGEINDLKEYDHKQFTDGREALVEGTLIFGFGMSFSIALLSYIIFMFWNCTRKRMSLKGNSHA